jgi:feruloyl esterase
VPARVSPWHEPERRTKLCGVGTSIILAAALILGAAPQPQGPTEAACTALAQLKLPDTTVTTAEALTGGTFTVPGSANSISNLPPFCRVAGVIAPTAESQIRFEVWLPIAPWNGKLAGVGNGGWAGSIPYPALAEQLRRTYAAAATNTGHDGAPGQNMARFAFEKPEQLVDFAYRAHHETAVKAKALVQAFYARPAARAYFIGCSSGGYEGLMAAQRFPDDYDGIVAGMPANNWTRLMAGDLDATVASFAGGSTNLPPAALGVLHRAAIAACDASDGVTDGAIENPLDCRVDPGALACKPGGDSPSCLTAAQVEAARRIYGGLKDPRSGARLYPGLAPGSEPFWVHRDQANPFPIPIAHYKWLVFRDPDWDWKTFDFSDPADYDAHQRAEAKLAPLMNATDPNLAAFRARGGKLLQYHGWYDQLIAPANSIDYFESVVAHFGGGKDRGAALKDVQTFYRLFMMPAVAHCGGGTGTSSYDMQTALEDWIERGIAPDRVVGSRQVGGVVDRTRPFCPYPQVAVYTGKGDTNDAANFTCRAAK